MNREASRRPMFELDAAQRGKGPYVWRFRAAHRWTHLMAIVSFYTLALTGIPLRFDCAPWAEHLIQFWGGVEMAGRIHRGAAILTFVYVFFHVFTVATRFFNSTDRLGMFWGPDSLVPRPRDAVDFVRQWRWYFGMGPKPRFGRFSYMEKLDYWGEVWGFFVIGGSGLMLWFPELFARVLPGWIFNVATVFHDYEAMIAIVFLFTIHFFNVHLRPDKFPLDAVMFTGRGTVEYMEEEHAELAERWEREGPRAHRPGHDELATPPTRVGTVVATVLGYAALGLGLAIIGMILWVLFC
jgi:cytochrome b subunit of formate dehydrogenase